MFRYRLHSPDGDDLGEATYAMMIKPGEEIHLDAGKRFRVLDVVPFEEEESPCDLPVALSSGGAHPMATATAGLGTLLVERNFLHGSR